MTTIDSRNPPLTVPNARQWLTNAAAALRSGAVLLLLGAMIIAFSLAVPVFINIVNLMSILQGVSVVAVLGIGVTLTLAVGGFDLSIGAIAASSVMAATYAMIVWQLNVYETVPLVLAFGALAGAINAFLIVRLRVPDLLATLAMMFLLSGLQLIPTAGRSISSGLILPDGSKAAGMVDKAFLLIGRASLGGIIIAARVGRGDISTGGSLLMDAVAASLIGFAVLDQRRPNIFGMMIGAVFVGVLLNGLTMLNAPYYTQDFVKGAVLVGALALTYGLGKSAIK
jgi:simple sugar transport system permease protein